MDAIRLAYGDDSSASDASTSSNDEATHQHKRARVDRCVDVEEEEAQAIQWKRSFPHVEGNWPSHVYVRLVLDERQVARCSALIKMAQARVGGQLELVPLFTAEKQELHLSLSRAFVLQYHQITPFVDRLRTALKWRKRYAVSFHGLLILVNDEHTRSFLALGMEQGKRETQTLLSAIDQEMKAWELPTYYEDPIFHTSIASSLGDALPVQLPNDELASLFPSDATAFRFVVAQVSVSIGNKNFTILLN